MAELLPEIVYECDVHGNITFVNKVGFEKFGYTQEDFNKGVNAMQFITLADRERAGMNLKKIMHGIGKGPFEYTAIRKDNSEFSVIMYSSPIISNNKPIGLRGIIVDVTKQVEVEKSLSESEERFRAILALAGSVRTWTTPGFLSWRKDFSIL